MPLTKVTYPIIQGAPINIQLFGADPSGNTDCSAALNAALASLATSEIIYIVFPEGDYLFTNKVTITRPVKFEGQGARIICSVPNDYVFELDNNEPTSAPNFEFTGLQFKWAGTFGTSTTGAIKCTNVVNLSITDNVFWGLGLSAIYITTVICGVIERNHFQEHLNANEIIYSTSGGFVYLLTIRDNFFQFTAPAKIKSCVYIRSVFNLDVANNAFEVGLNGLYLVQYGTVNAATIRNNFIEGCTTGLRLGNDNGDGFFGFMQGVTVENNVFTTNTTGILVAGAVMQASILNNTFDGAGTGINVTSKGYNSLNIGANYFYENVPLANQIVGYAYPFGSSSVDATKTVVDRTDATAGWTEQFDPSGFGTFTTSTPMPGTNATASLQLSFTSTPTDQYIIQKTVSATDLSTADMIVVPFYVNDPTLLRDTAVSDWWIVALGPDASNYWGFKFSGWSNNNSIVARKGWNIMMFPKTDAIVLVGAPASWAAITYTALRVFPKDGNSSPVVRFGGVFGFKLNGMSNFAGAQVL